MEEFKHQFDARTKTKEDLIEFYVTVIKNKRRYQYDPKKLILDLFTDKKNLYTVFLPKKEYSLTLSRADFGKLEFSEHRFINFLKFTEFTVDEIKKVFEAHREVVANEIPEKYRLSTPPADFQLSQDDTKNTSTIDSNGRLNMLGFTDKEIEELYS